MKTLMINLAGVTQWTECWPVNQIVSGSIPGQGTCLGFGPGPQLGVCEMHPIEMFLSHIDVSFLLSFPSLLSKNK